MQISDVETEPDSQSTDRTGRSSTTSGYVSDLDLDAEESVSTRLLMFSTIDGRNNATSTTSEWNPIKFGQKSTHSNQWGSRNGSDFRNLKFRCIDSGKSFDELIEGESFNSVSFAQGFSTKPKHDGQWESKSRALTTNRSKLQFHYSGVVPHVPGVKSVRSRCKMPYDFEGPRTVAVTSAGDQLASKYGSYYQSFGSGRVSNMEFQRLGSNSLLLAQKFSKIAERERELESKRRTFIKNLEKRSKWSSLQSPNVSFDSPSKKSTEYVDKASRQDASLEEMRTANFPGDNNETDEELTKLAEASCVTENLSPFALTSQKITPLIETQTQMQLHYSRVGPRVPGIKPVRSWCQTPCKSESPGYVAVKSAEWNPITCGNNRADRDQLASEYGSYYQSFDELVKSKSFQSLSLTEQFLRRAEHKRHFEFKRVLANLKKRTNWQSLQSPNGSFDSAQPSSKESMEYGGKASRQDALLASLQEQITASFPGDNETDEEFTTLAETSCVTESLSPSAITSTESKQPNQSTGTDQNAVTIKSQETKPVIETETRIQPLKFSDPTTNVGNESKEEEKIVSPESPTQHDHSTVLDAVNAIKMSVLALADHCYNKPIGAEKSASSQVFTAAFIRPTNIGNESIEEKQVSPLENLKDLDDSTTSIASVPAPTVRLYDEPIGSENSSTPQLSSAEFIHPTNINAQLTFNEVVEATPVASAMPPRQALSLAQPNIIQTSNPIQRPTRPSYQRSNKVIVQSNELIEQPLHVGSIIPYPRNAVRIDPNQIIFVPKPFNVQGSAGSIQMATKSTSTFPVKNKAKSNPHNSLSKRKKVDHLPPHAPAKANVKLPIPNVPRANSTAPAAASLKRKNKDNLQSQVPAKLQMVVGPTQGTMKNIGANSISVNLPDITIERVNMNQGDRNAAVAGVNRAETSGTSWGNRSLSDCVQFLQRNDVSVFKVPPKPSVLDKYIKILRKNNVSVERLKKNVSRTI